MKQLTLNYQKLTGPAGETTTSSLPAGFRKESNHANHIQAQENERERKMTAISGRKCLEQFERLNPGGLWAKTFLGYLVGRGDWFSTRCRLTWKLKGTKYNRYYFQLAVSTLRTDETGFGLLPTVKATEIAEHYDSWKQRMVNSKNPKNIGKTIPNLATMAKSGMLPTPTARDWKGTGKKEIIRKGKIQKDTLDRVFEPGTGGQLNPRFVAEMMGFPPNWTELPFLNGETKV